MGVFYVFLSYGTRIAWKKHLICKMAEGGEHSLYIVTNYDYASKVIQNVKEHNYNRYNINGLIIVDKDAVGKKISGIPVVADLKNAASYICQQWVDEVFVNIDESYSYPNELTQELLEMYKFRSMYMDAEERKAELMAQNKMSDGRMFKIDFDPRVIGNKVLPDGTRKTGIGEFIRKTSLDEFPQFWNVLNGVSGIIEPTKKRLDFTGFSLA